MAKYVFRPSEVINIPRKVLIEPPKTEELVSREKEVSEVKEETEAPISVSEKVELEELEKEREEFLIHWEEEKANLLAGAREEANQIVKNAEQVAFDEVKSKTDEARKIKQEAETEAENRFKQARADAERLLADANGKVEELRQETAKQAYAAGYEEGYKTGKEEVERLIDQIHKVLSKAIEKRKEIIDSAETQLINLVLLIAKKVVKVISENQRNVVINNVMQALGKLKARSDVTIRVNTADVQLATEHAQNFIKQLEHVAGVTVVEDAAIEKGGCIIETDFGQLDARITAQLQEIEEKIMELIPIKTMGLD